MPLAVAAILSLAVVYPWAYSEGFLAITASAFAMQFMGQGAWGVVPTYLNESAPDGSRAVLTGFVYQIGHLVATASGPLQTAIAAGHNGNYSFALLSVAGVVAVIIAICAVLGRESRGTEFAASAS